MRHMTRLVLLTAMLAAPAAWGAQAPSTQPAQLSKADQLFSDGRDALFRREYDRAIDLLTRAAAEDKTRTHYRLHLARALDYAGKMTQAKEILADILKSTPDHVEAGQLLAEIFSRQENWRSVVEVLEPLLKYRHDYVSYHLLAEAKYNLNDFDGARKYYEEAIKLNPASDADHYQLGNIYLSRGFYALAAESYQNALRLGMRSPVLHYQLGSAYFNLRNYFGRITTATVRSGQVGTISGEWYLIEAVPAQKDVFRVAPAESAIYQIARAMADGLGDRPDIQFLRANIYLNAGRYRDAYEMYARIKPIIPGEDLALFHYYYAQAAFGTGNYDEYLALLGEAIRLDKAAYEPTLVEALVRVAEQYNQAGQLQKYIEYLTMAVAHSPQTASLHLKLGNAYEEAGKHADAAAHWQLVLDLEPDHPRRLELVNQIARARAMRPGPTTRPS
jgi:tetratricopeptide (TPR) repeat protein